MVLKRWPTKGEWLLLALVVAGIVLMIVDWKQVLFAILVCAGLFASLFLAICVPTFVVSLLAQRSVTAAWQRTKLVAAGCAEFVGKIFESLH